MIGLLLGHYLVAASAALLGIGVYAHKTEEEHSQLLPLLGRSQFDASALVDHLDLPPAPDELRPIGLRRNENVVIYGGFVPFAGFGVPVGNSSFTVDTSRAARDPKAVLRQAPAVSSPGSVDVAELEMLIDSGLRQIPCSGCESKVLLFLDGQALLDSPLLPHALQEPIQYVAVGQNGDNSWHGPEGGRWYHAHSYTSWDGEIVLTYFVRAALSGSTLMVDLVRTILPPVASKYRLIDHQARPHWRTDLERFGSYFVVGLAYPLMAAASVGRRVAETFGHGDEPEEDAIRRDLGYNYGAVGSLRERMSSREYTHYVQRSDIALIIHAAEQRIMDVIVDYLDGRGIDASMLRERQIAILNTGLIGDVNATAVSVGNQSGARVDIAPASRH